ncbi:hypothetical protein IMG5_099640 [Ichthyophthirius multifiliis]|uniref:Uncharacterized protein n=1 Tax=Ichthyophthirius multifiliis TaxID=5932 RepID=G0QS71_ICHMU|nr:hypothetical protein IMG5_099640 [Ichthyophthirius multifiliis]EGR31936.1 hypothetical protein IMG5_099640 [Ichthyophthirius multifiliis]|eukprot:XP_004035422.1 hypothetical protein IMG5_099640 [Ichthyophthirius multifiliis]
MILVILHIYQYIMAYQLEFLSEYFVMNNLKKNGTLKYNKQIIIQKNWDKNGNRQIYQKKQKQQEQIRKLIKQRILLIQKK